MVTVKIDLNKINAAATEAFKETCFLMGTSFTQSISEPKWDWDGETKRYGNGSGGKDKTPHEVGSPRDIVDTGRLRASQQLEFLGDDQAQISWNTEYALFVLLGYTCRNGTTVKGRDWVSDGLQRFDAQAVFAQLLAAKLK